METRGKFVLIGAFTLAGMLGLLALILWFARVELDRTYDYYDVRFTSVSGLSDASDVRFSGLPVGRVVDVRLAPERDGRILVRLEVDAETPVRTDSIATIEAQGVTGVSFVQISGGSQEADLLEQASDDVIPEIEAGRSVLQSLSEEAPRLLTETLDVLAEVNTLLGGENQDLVRDILTNTAAASETLNETLVDLSAAASAATEFGAQAARFNSVLETVSDDLEQLLQTADRTSASSGGLADEAEAALDAGTETLAAAQGAIGAAETYIEQDLTLATTDLRDTLAGLRAEIATLSADAQGVMDVFVTTGTTATARLEQAEAILQSADVAIAQVTETMVTVDESADAFYLLMEDEGEPLLVEARATLATATEAIDVINAAAQTDLPVSVADIREATRTATTRMTDVSDDLTSASGRVDELTVAAEEAFGQVAETFANANTTLEAVNTALDVGTRTLTAAEGAFAGADRLLNEDIDGLISGLEASLASLDATIAQVADDVPGITESLREASEAAEASFGSLQGILDGAAGPITEFAAGGLPTYTRLAQETRELIRNLDRLTNQIQRDPARFFLDQRTPEFRR